MANPRDRVVPFNQRTDSGRIGFRYPDEPVDERPVIVLAPFWTDASEQCAYEDAVQQHPRKDSEGPMAYAQRISSIVVGKYAKAGLAMPRTRMSQAEWQRRQNEAKRKAWDANDWRGM